MSHVRGFLKTTSLHALRVVTAALLGTALLVGVYLLPTEPMQPHMDSSAQLILEEGEYPEVHSWCTSRMDNFTDTIILMTAANESGGSPVQQAMTAAMPGFSEGESMVDMLRAHYMDGRDYDTQLPYYHYWHGYLLLIKPLMLLTDYQGIRILNGVGQAAVLIAVGLLLWKKGAKKLILPYFISLMFLAPWLLPRSLQFSSCFYLMNFGMIGVLLLKDRLPEKALGLFCWLGIATAYFDFLTYPMAVLGVPAIVYFYLRGSRNWKKTIGEGAGITLSWGFGYAAMWACKWGIGSLLTGQNVLSMAGEKLVERSSAAPGVGNSALYYLRIAVTQNIRMFLTTPVLLLFSVLMLLLILRAGRCLKKAKPGWRKAVQALLPFGILALFPVAWYLCTANHSSIHYWFTNKALIVSAFAVLGGLERLGDDTIFNGIQEESHEGKK